MKDIVAVTSNEDIGRVMAKALGEDYNVFTISSLEDFYQYLMDKKAPLNNFRPIPCI